MHEVLVWGIGTSYDRFRRFLNESQVKINALISSYDEHIKSIDGIDVIKPEDIKNFNYEFIIVASSFFEEIVKIATGGGYNINREKIIDAKVFELNGFDFDRYVSIINKNISIVSDDCWGGVLYHSLGLKFNTPFINFSVGHDEYAELVNNLEYYLTLPLLLNSNKFSHIIGNLGRLNAFHFTHDKSSNEIMQKWNRRIKRFNFKNYLIKMTLYNDNDLKVFEKINTKNKIGFYYKKTNIENIICLEDWYDINIRFNYEWSFVKFTNSVVRDIGSFSRYYDVFKLLNGESDFMRNITYK